MAEEYTRKQFSYRGKSLDELKAMNIREFAKLIPSKERRYLLRNFQDVENFVSLCKKKISKNKKIETHKRDILIVPEMIGMSIHVHNGQLFNQIDIVNDMLGHKLGEFALTRGKINHGKAGVGATKGSKNKSKK